MQDQAQHGGTNGQAGRKLGFWMCTALVVGNTIGIGIFLLPARWRRMATTPCSAGSSLCSAAWRWRGCSRDWRATCPTPTVPTATSAARSARCRRSWRCGRTGCRCGSPTRRSPSASSATSTRCFRRWCGMPPALQALALLWLFVLINLLGVRTGGRVQVVTTALKLLPMLAVAALGVWLLVTHPSSYTAAPADRPGEPGAADGGLDHRLVRHARLRVGDGAGRSRARPRPHHPARDHRRHADDGGDLPGGFVVPLLLIPSDELAASRAPFSDLLDRLVGAGYGRAAGAVRGRQRPGRAERLGAAGRRTDPHHRQQRRPAGGRSRAATASARRRTRCWSPACWPARWC